MKNFKQQGQVYILKDSPWLLCPIRRQLQWSRWLGLGGGDGDGQPWTDLSPEILSQLSQCLGSWVKRTIWKMLTCGPGLMELNVEALTSV